MFRKKFNVFSIEFENTLNNNNIYKIIINMKSIIIYSAIQ